MGGWGWMWGGGGGDVCVYMSSGVDWLAFGGGVWRFAYVDHICGHVRLSKAQHLKGENPLHKSRSVSFRHQDHLASTREERISHPSQSSSQILEDKASYHHPTQQ